MVDFDNETTIGTPAGDVIKIIILQRRYDVLEALESYNKTQGAGAEGGNSIFRARLTTLFYELHPALKRQKELDVEKLKEQIQHGKQEDLIAAFEQINDTLDQLRLTRFDTRKQIDTTRVEHEDKEKGL